MNRFYSVTDPLMLEAVCAVIPMMLYKPSVAAKTMIKGGGSSTEEIIYSDEYGREVI